MFGPVFRWTLLGLVVADLASFFSTYDERAVNALAILSTAAVLILAFKRLDLALLIVIAELVHGSQGHLFEFHLADGREIPVRMLFFAAAMLAYAARFKLKTYQKMHDRTKSVTVLFALLLLVVGLGAVRGLARGNPVMDVFSDANAYAYLLLLLPLRRATRMYSNFRRDVQSVIAAGALETAILTVAVILAYRFNLAITHDLYPWIRDWGLGQVTPALPAAFNRVFFQSHIWVLLAIPVLQSWAVVGTLLSIVALSFSRSLWLGALAAFPFAPRVFLRAVPIAAIIMLLVALLVAPASIGLARARTNITTEPAAASRWSLLPVLWDAIKKQPILGYGFGSKLTYETKDPKLIREFGSSQFTTFAFEWGYLEQWFKMGILGLGALLALLVVLFRRTRGGLRAALVALAVVHVFSPYLNHPLGLGFLILADILGGIPHTSSPASLPAEPA